MTEEQILRAAQGALTKGPLEGELKLQVGQIFDRMRPNVLRACVSLTRDPVRAEDLFQQAVAIALSRLHELDLQGSLQNFVIGICRNLIRSEGRKISELLTEDGTLDPASDLEGSLSALRGEEQHDLLNEAISLLPLEEQEILYLRYVVGLPVERITAELSLGNASGARGVLVRARRHLTEHLRERLAARGHGSSFFRTSIS